jgi:enamine deaminase RidA (YjgF/YER057c/UK114 family)
MTTRELIVPPGLEPQYQAWRLAPGLRVGDTLYCSGQLGIDHRGELPSDAEAQMTNAFEHVKAILEQAGFDFGDVVELSSFHVGLVEELGTFARVRDRYIKEPYPAQTAVGVAALALPGAIIELKATAIRQD